jgi:hypothetical protein
VSGTAKFCGQCGGEASAPDLGACYDCATPDQMTQYVASVNRTLLAVMRQWDAAQYAKGVAAVAEARAAELEAAQAQTPGLETAVTVAIAAERAQQDRCRDLDAHAAQCAEAHRVLDRDRADPGALSETLARSRAAADIAEGAKAALEGLAAARQQAEAALSAHQARVRELDDLATGALRNKEHPPALVPMSAHTGFACSPLLVLLQPDARGTEGEGGARLQAKVLADLSGLTDELTAKGRADGRKAAEAEARQRLLRIAGHSGPRMAAIPMPGGQG